jgi:hypothetical protein
MDDLFREGEAPCEPSAGSGLFEHQPAGTIGRLHRDLLYFEPWQGDVDRILIYASDRPLRTAFG